MLKGLFSYKGTVNNKMKELLKQYPLLSEYYNEQSRIIYFDAEKYTDNLGAEILQLLKREPEDYGMGTECSFVVEAREVHDSESGKTHTCVYIHIAPVMSDLLD